MSLHLPRAAGFLAPLTISLGLCLETLCAQADGPSVRLDGYDYRPGRDSESSAALSEGPGLLSERRLLCLVELADSTSEARLNALRAVGLEPLQYLPERVFLVFGPASSLAPARQLPFVRWAGAFPPNLKLTPKLQSVVRDAASGEPPGASKLDVILQLFDVGDSRELLHFLQQAGGQKLWVSRPARRVHVRALVASSLLSGLARWPSLFRIEEFPDITLKSERALVSSTGAFPPEDLCVLPGYDAWLERKGIRGQGKVIHLMDDGVERGNASGLPGTAHPDLLGAIADVDNATSDPEADSRSGHGSLNASLLVGRAATGVRDFDGFRFGIGVTPLASVFATKIFNNFGRFETGPHTFTDLIGKASQRGALVSSNSWGASVFGAYDALSVEFDALTRDASAAPGLQPMTFVFAAGNEGDDVPGGFETISSPGTSKNVISVGASESCDSEAIDGCGVGPKDSNSIRDVPQFSSRGPNADGRLAPVLVAPGTHMIGVASSAVDYDGAGICDPFWPLGQILHARGSGTSHACPLVAGAATLFQEWFAAYTGSQASPALVRAALTAAARDLAGGEDGYGGQLDPVPSRMQGWGRLSMDALVPDKNTTPEALHFDEEVVLSDNEDTWDTVVFPIHAGKPVRIALAWSDPPAVPGASPTLVNDLDLEVESAGKLYRGNNLQRGSSVPDGAADQLNNLECVLLERPGPMLRIRVKATAINGDGAPGGDSTDQDFALVVYGGTLQSSRGVVSFRRGTYACDSLVGLRVSDLDLKGRPSVQVAVSSNTAAQGVVASLTEVSPGTGVFDGAIQLGKDVSHLFAANGSLLTARYLDADDGNGAATESTSTATVDCLPPTITGVTVGELTESTASVSWTTSEDSIGTLRYGTECVALHSEVSSPRRSRSHSLTLTGLPPGSRQFFTLQATDTVGNTTSDDQAGACYKFSASSSVCSFQDDIEPAPMPGWTHQAAQGPDDWAHVQFGGSHSPRRAWHSPGFDGFKDASLVTPPLEIEPGDSLIFWHTFQLENGYDGAVLEVSANGGATWNDLGPFITQGGYSEIISGNPLGERMAWTGQRTGEMTKVRVDLSTWVGAARLIRFRVGYDASNFEGFGWYVDDVMVCRSLNKRATLSLNRKVYRCGDPVHVRVSDLDLVNASSTEVRVSSAFHPEPVTVQLREKTPGTGVFTKDVILSAGAGGFPGVDGDEILVSYRDADDGTGTGPALIVERATVDCKAPIISHVRFLELLDDEATLAWETDEPAIAEVTAGPTCTDLPIRALLSMGGTSHALTLGGLDSAVLYSFKIKVSDEAGNVTIDDAGGTCRQFRPASVCTRRFDFEDGAPGWAHTAAIGKDAWRLETPQFVRSGPTAWVIPGLEEFADVALSSPPFLVLPGSWLAFWHTYDFESTFDGGVIEASEDGGSTWKDLGPQIRRGGYTSVLVPPNPLAGRRAWSGGVIGPLGRVVVDLGPWAGRWLQVRFRVVSDASVAGAGWIVDHVEVCQAVREDAHLGMDRESYRCEDKVRLQVLDTSLIGQGAVQVLIASTSEPIPEVIQLAERAPGSGVFEGEVSLDSVDRPRTLVVKSADAIRVSYADENDDSGNPRELVVVASVDCKPPQLSDITVAERTSSKVVITWKTDEESIGQISVGSSCDELSRVTRERTPTKEHRLESRGLPPGTAHFFRVEAMDKAQNVVTESLPEGCRAFSTLVRYAEFEETVEPAPQGGWDTAARWRVLESPLATTPSHVWGIEGVRQKDDASLTTPPFYPHANGMLEFWHSFGFASGLTGGVVEGSKDGGETWIDLEPDILEGPYSSFILAGNPLEGRRAWTGGQVGPMSRVRVSLRSLVGTEALVRLRFASQGIGDEGSWLVDDLRITQDVAESAFVGFGSLAYNCTSKSTVQLADLNLTGTGVAMARVSSTSQREPVLVQLSEATPGFFRGQVQLGQEPSPGVVRVEDGDTLRILFEDPTGNNGQAAPVEGFARIDCTPPAVKNLTIVGSGVSSAQVLWETTEPARGHALHGASCERLDRLAPSSSVKTTHSALLRGLEPETDVFVTIRVRDNAGNEGALQDCIKLSIERICQFEDTLEPPRDGWMHTASFGPDDWEIREFDRSHSPKRSFHGPNRGQPKDAALVMPPVDIEPGSALSFWHTYELEEGFDGAAIQISTDQGVTWADLGHEIFEGHYTGDIFTPEGPLPGWTGGTLQKMSKVSVSLDHYVGAARRIRFRIVCDDSLGTPGWYIDDVLMCSFKAHPAAPSFARGNCNADGKIDLGDAIFVLDHLFKGGSAPVCRSACDSDHNDTINLSDAVFLLNHLFRGGRPLDPPVECAPDLAPGQVECAAPACLAQ